MRFRQYLMENNGISFDGFLHSLNTIIERKLFLWRGLELDRGEKMGSPAVDQVLVHIFKFNGRSADRHSVTGDSTIQNVMSKWKGFPNRKRSSFASQSREHVERFGGDFALIIPADHPNLFGYTPYDVNEPDFGAKAFNTQRMVGDVGLLLRAAIEDAREHYQDGNESSKVRTLLVELGTQLNALSFLKEPVMDKLNGESFDMAVKFCDAFAKRMRKLDMKSSDIGWSVYETFNHLYEEVESHGSTLIAELFNDVKPSDFEASIHTLQNLPVDHETSGDEIWFEGPYLAINRSDLRNFSADDLAEYLVRLRDKVKQDHELSKKIEI